MIEPLLNKCLQVFRLLLFITTTTSVSANLPYFFLDSNMALVLVPYDVPVGSTIYRLKAADSDLQYPLLFSVPDAVGTSLVSLQPYPCSVHDDFCVCDVQLKRPLEAGITSTFRVRVRDTSGQMTTVVANVAATEGHTSIEDTFVDLMKPVRVSEDTPVNSVIKTMTARRGDRNIKFDLKGTEVLSLENSRLTRNGAAVDIVLRSPLDFETENLIEFNIFAEHGFRDTSIDTRNVVSLSMILLVEDVQDSAPVFVQAPSVATISSNTKAGEIIGRFRAVDTDKHNAREIRYRLLYKESIGFNNFFTIDHQSGNLSVTSSLDELLTSLSGAVVLHVLAEEVTRSLSDRPALSATTPVAIIVQSDTTLAPSFAQSSYVAMLPENPPAGLVVAFSPPSKTIVRFKQHQRGTFSLNIIGDIAEKIFEVVPSVIKADTEFDIRVKNGVLLDFETLKKHHIQFKLEAKQLDHDAIRSPLRSHCNLSVNIQDVNDNAPKFDKSVYDVVIDENVTRGTIILKVTATDADSGDNGLVSYIGLTGDNEDDLSVDPSTGEIRVKVSKHQFDFEQQTDYRLLVLATDSGVPVRTGTASIRVQVLDANDNAPQFTRSFYTANIAADGSSLVQPLRISATDSDSGLNGKIFYRISGGDTQRSHFTIDRNTGVISVIKPISPDELSEQVLEAEPRLNSFESSRQQTSSQKGSIMIRVMAFDAGSPQLSSEVPVYLYKRETVEALMTFVLGKTPNFVMENMNRVERELASFTGGSAEITDVASYSSRDNNNGPIEDKSLITAIVRRRFDASFDTTSISQDFTRSQIQLAAVRDVWFWLLIAFFIVVVFILAIVSCCFYWSFCAVCCPDVSCYRRKMVAVSDEEPLAYISMDKNRPTIWTQSPRNYPDRQTMPRIPSPVRSVGSSLVWSEPRTARRVRTHRVTSRARSSAIAGKERVLLVREEVPGQMNHQQGDQVILLPAKLDSFRRSRSTNSWNGGRIYRTESGTTLHLIEEGTHFRENQGTDLYKVEDVDETELEKLELDRRSLVANSQLSRSFSPAVEVLTLEEDGGPGTIYQRHGNVDVLNLDPTSGPEDAGYSRRRQNNRQVETERGATTRKSSIKQPETMERTSKTHLESVSETAAEQYTQDIQQEEIQSDGKKIIMRKFIDSYEKQGSPDVNADNKDANDEKNTSYIGTFSPSDNERAVNRVASRSHSRESPAAAETETAAMAAAAGATSSHTQVSQNQMKILRVETNSSRCQELRRCSDHSITQSRSDHRTTASKNEDQSVNNRNQVSGSRPASNTSLRFSNNMIHDQLGSFSQQVNGKERQIKAQCSPTKIKSMFQSDTNLPKDASEDSDLNLNHQTIPASKNVHYKEDSNRTNFLQHHDQSSQSDISGRKPMQSRSTTLKHFNNSVNGKKAKRSTINGKATHKRHCADKNKQNFNKNNLDRSETKAKILKDDRVEKQHEEKQTRAAAVDASGDSGICVDQAANNAVPVPILSGNESTISSNMVPGMKRKKNQFLEKKSIFTIAYDDVHTEKLRGDTPLYEDL